MGKHQRRKDNSQAASSSKATQLLQATGSGIPFIGLETSALGLFDLGEMTANDCADLAPEFRILLKKLTKRDTLTREKAVKEFAELLKNVPLDQLKLSFEYFAPIYQRLVTDANSTIRSASNKLLAQYIWRLKKEAPSNCLKQTLPFLLFSTADHSIQVVKSAFSLLNECFAAEKKELVFANFADDALSLSLSVANRRHRLVLSPQLLTEEESNEQRRDRLIAQSFNCIDSLSAHSSNLPSLLATVGDTFTNSESLNPLMALGNSVKVSLYRLATKIAQNDPNLLIRGKFVSVLFNNLNLSDSSLFQNAFECFMRLAQEDALFEHFSLDKAIVPKVLSLVRKKEGHWELLANALLPLFSVIFDRIGPSDRQKQVKFAFSVIDSFFDGAFTTIQISSWSCAFVEICKFSLVKLLFDTECESDEDASEFLTQFFLRVTKFTDFILSDFPVSEYAKLADFVAWLQLKLSPGKSAFALELFSELEQHLLSLLPKSDAFLTKLLDVLQENGKFGLKLLVCPNSSAISNSLLIKSAEAILSSGTDPSKFDHLLAIVTVRIQMVGDSIGFDSETVRLINILCQILAKTENRHNSLADRIKMDNVWMCLHSVDFVLSDFCDLLGHESLFCAFCTIFHNLQRLESEFGRVKRILELALAYICEKCSDSEREHLVRILPNEAQLLVKMPDTVNFVFDYLVKRGKVSARLQHFFVESLFKTSLYTPDFVNSSAFLLLRQFECDTPKMRQLLHLFLSSSDCTISQ
ncbi:hypothetical protein niasHT_023472 [Heterodera trifolii]|uniref:E3 ubiquitin-protein ligase listerin n=1 Tax=Heterodera trifolii TaxID=157864 RepID=A0ABD2JJ81_9BILA